MVAKKLIILFLFVSSITHAVEYDAIINLGGDCQVAYQMHIHGLRKQALPFDKLITPFDSLCSLLQAGFEGFLERDNFIFVAEEESKYILDKKFGTRLIHDCALTADFLNDYEKFFATYSRRIARLFDLLVTSNKLLFIRKIITREQAGALEDLLSCLCKDKEFHIIAVDGTDEIKTDWQLPKTSNYYLRQPEPYSWKGDPQAWLEIFNAEQLATTDTLGSTQEI